jgi:hypothetical protein
MELINFEIQDLLVTLMSKKQIFIDLDSWCEPQFKSLNICANYQKKMVRIKAKSVLN